MGKSVVVTGANSGIGLATALELAAAGYDVIGTVRSAAKAEALREAAAERGLAVRTVTLDVSDSESTRAGFAEIADRSDGGPWAVVNNAGFAQAGAVEDVDDEAIHDQLEVNLIAPMRVAKLVLPKMRERGDGRIVNVSSIAGRASLPLMGWYCASKHGLEAVTDALRMEVAAYGVKVVLVEPGSFGTGIWDGARLPTRYATAEYQSGLDRGRRGTTSGQRFMPDPVWVARTVRLALGTPKPLARYLIGADAVGMVLTERLAPTAISDRVKGVLAGLRRLR